MYTINATAFVNFVKQNVGKNGMNTCALFGNKFFSYHGGPTHSLTSFTIEGASFPYTELDKFSCSMALRAVHPNEDLSLDLLDDVLVIKNGIFSHAISGTTPNIEAGSYYMISAFQAICQAQGEAKLLFAMNVASFLASTAQTLNCLCRDSSNDSLYFALLHCRNNTIYTAGLNNHIFALQPLTETEVSFPDILIPLPVMEKIHAMKKCATITVFAQDKYTVIMVDDVTYSFKNVPYVFPDYEMFTARAMPNNFKAVFDRKILIQVLKTITDSGKGGIVRTNKKTGKVTRYDDKSVFIKFGNTCTMWSETVAIPITVPCTYSDQEYTICIAAHDVSQLCKKMTGTQVTLYFDENSNDAPFRLTDEVREEDILINMPIRICKPEETE